MTISGKINKNVPAKNISPSSRFMFGVFHADKPPRITKFFYELRNIKALFMCIALDYNFGYRVIGTVIHNNYYLKS